MDYKNGRIYKILNYIDDDIYVGSTCQPLSKRMAKHRSSINSTTKGHRALYAKMRELGVEQFYIELIEECPCDNKEQLHKREGEFIREFGTLNHVISGRSKKEWTHDNKEHCKERAKQYYKDNKEQIKETQKQYKISHSEPLNAKRKEYRQEHVTEIKAVYDKWNTKFDCPCGGKHTKAHTQLHFKTKMHQNYLAQLEQNTE